MFLYWFANQYQLSLEGFFMLIVFVCSSEDILVMNSLRNLSRIYSTRLYLFIAVEEIKSPSYWICGGREFTHSWEINSSKAFLKDFQIPFPSDIWFFGLVDIFKELVLLRFGIPCVTISSIIETIGFNWCRRRLNGKTLKSLNSEDLEYLPNKNMLIGSNLSRSIEDAKGWFYSLTECRRPRTLSRWITMDEKYSLK